VYPDGIARQWDVLFDSDYDVKFLTALIDKMILEHMSIRKGST